MKQTTIAFMHCLLFLMIALPALADEDRYGGFSGMLFIGTGYRSADLALDDAEEEDNRTISSLSQSSRSQSGAEYQINASLSYTFASTGTTLGVDNEYSSLGLFASQELGKPGCLALRFDYEEFDVFTDPFLTGTARSVTGQTVTQFRIDWENIMSGRFSAGYSMAVLDIDNDAAGNRDNRLKRDGNIHAFSLGYRFFENGGHSLAGIIHAQTGDLSGNSTSYKGAGLELTHAVEGNGWDIVTGAFYTHREHDAVHPEFGRTRDDDEYGLSCIYSLHEPFGFENYFISAMGLFAKNDSNINFYDSRELVIGMGVGYMF